MTAKFLKDEYFKQIGKDIYLYNGCNLDMAIYKYMDIFALFDIMAGNFRVRLKKEFSDYHEQGYMKDPYFQSCSEKELKDPFRKYEWEKKKLSVKIPTSCFTSNNVEIHAMWKAFTFGYTGVRVSTTIGQFINSLRFTGYSLYIGPIKYVQKIVWKYDVTEFIFSKNECYYPEKEVRIYFIPNDGQFGDENICLNISSTNLFSEILLSPFLPKILRGTVKNNLEVLYPLLKDKIHYSKIWETTFNH